MARQEPVLDSGDLYFTIESRVLRELGERLVKEPEIALIELVKNAYDADASFCEVIITDSDSFIVKDDGHGMTLANFIDGWMRIGTSSKVKNAESPKYERIITGEKGIGRFAVRFLGQHLIVESVADDKTRQCKTHLSAQFDWPQFDKSTDIGKVTVPYTLRRAAEDETEGTTLTIGKLREEARKLNLRVVRTSSLTVITPFRSLMRLQPTLRQGGKSKHGDDPGFQLILAEDEDSQDVSNDVATKILDNFVLRAVLELKGNRITLSVFQKGNKEPYIYLKDTINNEIGSLYADVRFFPQRGGTFSGLPLDGRSAKTWVKSHAGVAVFDRTFRVYPYGTQGDDWLRLSVDSATNIREPRSSIAKKHFPMDDATRHSTELNYMLRLPHTEQLIGVVQVEGVRGTEQKASRRGLIAAADREGFLRNRAFSQLEDVIRGVAETIAYADRELQLSAERQEDKARIAKLKRETKEAIAAIENNPSISASVRRSLVQSLSQTQQSAEEVIKVAHEREATLEIMSLMGVVAGFMTHEFGTALDDLQRVHDRLLKLGKTDQAFQQDASSLAGRIASLRDFITYSQGYVQAAAVKPSKPFPARPRVQQVVRVFGKYAQERGIAVSIEIEPDLMAPLVPAALYNGLALNLYTNALKAVTASIGSGPKEIVFRAWNEKANHYLAVSDTGIGIPEALRNRIFDPLFTTTATNRDPLGSGLGLGLALVRRCVDSFGGKVEVIDPPPGYSTCFRIKLPLVNG